MTTLKTRLNGAKNSVILVLENCRNQNLFIKHLEIKKYSLSEITDEYIGKKGTDEREQFEQELRLDLLGLSIKKARKKRNLTQSQLGELLGVQKAQISKLENNLKDARFETILKVFRALDAKVSFIVELE